MRALRNGLTLIEVMIVIAILAIMAAIVYPNVFRPKPTPAATEMTVIEQAKALAIARTERVRVRIERDGTWQIVSDVVPGSTPLASGSLSEAPPQALVLRVTELGACLPVEGATAIEGATVDAVSCSKQR
ncbi:MAG TPA: prepilin-type N-terminal cleavage/methylation domain-containing protein [Gemmatimonadaceae bacterium]|nr:prepilin-type N-terminal cleavage/methylation domain-containing protein [Gemmatimonadaceae bacterium]